MFWERFYNLCKEHKTTPTTVAKAIGISHAATTKWKNGTVPNADVLEKIADYFRVTTDYLLGRIPLKTSDKICFLMKCDGYTDDSLAEAMNVSSSIVSQWKSGELSPNSDEIIKLSKLFSVTVDYLLYDKNFYANEFYNFTDKEFVALDIYRETNGELVGESQIYPQDIKEYVYPILKNIKNKATPEGQPLTDEQEALLNYCSDLSNDDLEKVIDYIELLKLKNNAAQKANIKLVARSGEQKQVETDEATFKKLKEDTSSDY